jgi:hypothetical protein
MNLFTIVAFEKSEDGYFNGLIQELSWDALCDLLPDRQYYISLTQGFERLMSFMSQFGNWSVGWMMNLLQMVWLDLERHRA